ncbi:hypothetical protein [Verrucosispora sioxanthis]|uniref:Uncharacterized protein n=1 Tax=Verrucosispora sioxanthis TaxID=2499994 RepID=A0A6M1LA68_9ACTN|nr:hypothetical protein [Verrucosispora sioxanthis]NEE65914.1 hypothetical protein [Verrucosispora sioxanthis]NGM15024.1 hypothetical protein [Verrucosispora sioxanthis]
MEYFSGSLARSTSIRPISDLDLTVVLGKASVDKTGSLAEIVDRLTAKLDRYYDKTTGAAALAVPDAPSRRPDTFKIAVRAIKSHRLASVVVQGRPRSVTVTFPQSPGLIDVLPALGVEADEATGPQVDLRSAPLTLSPGQVPLPESPDTAALEREQLRRGRDLERRARILLRRMLRIVRVRRARAVTVAAVNRVDHSTESHRSRAPGRKTWSSPAFRALAAA